MTRILYDYTGIVAASNVLACRDATYPSSSRNPFENLIRGLRTPSDSPMWIEMASLANLVESIVIHEEILLPRLWGNDRIEERGRYSDRPWNDVEAQLGLRGIVNRIDADASATAACEALLRDILQDTQRLTGLIEAYFSVLKQPVYMGLPDVFSHSQTIYTFDGETIWRMIEAIVPLRPFTQQFQAAARREGFQPTLQATIHYYPEYILGFLVRGLLYDHLAFLNDVPYQPHAARSPLILANAARGTTPADLGRLAVGFIEGMRGALAEEVNQKLGSPVFEVYAPPVFTAVLRRAKRPEDVIPAALAIRDSDSARRYRAWIQEALVADSASRIVEVSRELEQLKTRMKKELGLTTDSVDVKLSMIGVKAEVPRWLQTDITARFRRHYRFLRNLAYDAINCRSLDDLLIPIFRQ